MARQKQFCTVLNMIKAHVFDGLDSLISETESLLRNTLARPGNLMLSGGSTPYVVYNRIAADPCPVHPGRKLFLSDERMQSYASERNNAHNLMPMLNALNCQDRFVRVDTTLPPADAARKFETYLQCMNAVDLGFLGMGSDGHTAGFFTKEQASGNGGPLTLYTDRPDGMQGVSVTPAFLKRVERLILLVTGESKRAVIENLLSAPETIAAGIALAEHPNTELWTDVRLSL